MEREPAKTAATCQLLLQQMVQSSQQARDGGQEDWCAYSLMSLRDPC